MPSQEIVNPYSAPPQSPPADTVARLPLLAPRLGFSNAIRAEGAYAPGEVLRAFKFLRGAIKGTLLLYLVLLLIAAASAGLAKGVDLTTLGIVAGIATLAYGAVLWRIRRALIQQWQRREGIFQPHARLFAPEGVANFTDRGLSIYQWETFKDATRSDRMIVFHFARQNVILPIPRSHFASQADWDRFRALVDEKLPRR